MTLFRKDKNILFEKTADIINDIVQNHAVYTKKDLEQYFENCGLLLYEHEEILTDKNFILYEDKQSGQIRPRLSIPVPYCLQYPERQCLRELADDPAASLLLKEETLRKIKQFLPDETEDISLFRNQKNHHTANQNKMRTNARLLMQAILYSHPIRITAAGKTRKLIPYRLSYSNRNNEISFFGTDGRTVISVSIEEIDGIQILEEKRTTDIEQWLEQQKRYMTLQVEEQKNVVERCFSMFSHLKKSAVYDRNLHQYHMDVEYYAFEEKEIIRDLLSFGSYVIVLSPRELQGKMIDLIKQI